MGRHLIVANQTLGGDQLDRTVTERIERGDSQFYVVVPMTAPKHESDSWSRGFPVHGGMSAVQIDEARRAIEEDARRREELFAEARRRAEQRLQQMLEKIESAGGVADGEVGDADPAIAVKAALESQTPDEVIVSTLPAKFSRWVKMDLPSKVSRMTDAPVVTIEAEE
jgi:hypothetical protein